MEPSRSSVGVADVPIKRPPEDEEPFDPSRASPKRQTMQPPVAANGQNNPFNNPSTEGMDHRLIGMTPGELITIILSMRSSHEQQVSELQNRYEAASRQLEQLTHTLNGHFASQIAALQSVQQSVASISASEQTRSLSSTIAAVPNATNGGLALPPTNPSFSAPRQTPVPPIVAAPPSTPTANNLRTTSTPRSARFEAPSVAAFTPSRTATSASVEPQDKKDLKITQSDTPNQPPTVEASHLDTAWEAWEEFRYGRNGNPSLETLDAIWGPRWRQDFKLREFYKRRKAIADKIKQYMADGIDEQSAVRALDTQRGKRKLNWLSLRILDERKAQKEQYKEAQKAALVNKAALQNLGNAPAAAAGANMSPPQTQHTL
ncbi:transcriptional activator of glycolytic enzymes-domain-containing protein [Diaporthe sp. PMI_573]|nr:transcriptional activator of glycolytic enzymes-domain-containing protein [Diaporthaceae sp. PMI_573]